MLGGVKKKQVGPPKLGLESFLFAKNLRITQNCPTKNELLSVDKVRGGGCNMRSFSPPTLFNIQDVACLLVAPCCAPPQKFSLPFCWYRNYLSPTFLT